MVDVLAESLESKAAEHVSLEVAAALISEAAEFRLRSKHAAHARAASLHGPDNALFHAIATGLGYKNNAIPFLLTAQVPALRRAAGVVGEALLFGLAGFLEPRSFDNADEVTRRYLKPLWTSGGRFAMPCRGSFSIRKCGNSPASAHRITRIADWARSRLLLRASMHCARPSAKMGPKAFALFSKSSNIPIGVDIGTFERPRCQNQLLL
jgi:hypothetical protein